MILIETITALIGIYLLVKEVSIYRFRNYATSVFLLCFVPLLCIYPLISRIVVGGAYSVQPGDYLVFSDYSVYLVYQAFCLGILWMVYLTGGRQTLTPSPEWRSVIDTNIAELAIVVAIISLGIALYVRSTGFTVGELITASRFEWFNNSSYSSAIFVVSSYLMTLSPVGLLLAIYKKRYRWVFFLIVAELIFFGILSKDRKWLIYILSAGFAFVYYHQNFAIKLQKKFLVIAAMIVSALVFWQVFRGVYFEYFLTGKGDVSYLAQEMAIELLTRGDFPYYYNASITAINMNINHDYFIPLGLLSRQFLFFLPADYSFGLKVEDISALFSDALQAGDAVRRGNMPPGLFGLFVISFGWFGGIILCALIPLLLRWLDRYIQKASGIGSFVLAAHMMSAVLLLLRGDDSSATYFIVFSLAVFLLIRPNTVIGTRRVESAGNQ
ncbi:O-antigen polymerase [Qipengyuania sp.]|uniref:O-antigen polymerase n=1 Tax=Qipengyuania sp. TaxID=2004515 RepID=UPI0035C7AF1E